MYFGMPTNMLVDQGSVFISDEWKYACELNKIQLVETGTESQNSLGAVEKFRSYLRHSKIEHDVLLAISVKALKD